MSEASKLRRRGKVRARIELMSKSYNQLMELWAVEVANNPDTAPPNRTKMLVLILQRAYDAMKAATDPGCLKKSLKQFPGNPKVKTWGTPG